MDIFISSTTVLSLCGIKIRDTMNVNTEKLKSTREGIKKLVRILLGCKVILLQFLKVIEVSRSSGNTIKANNKEMEKKVITLNIKYILTKK